jgi:hypothetical protein
MCGCGGCGPHGQLRCWRAWLRSSLRVARGSRPRGMGLVRAGSGINQEVGRAAPGGGPDMGAITRCPRPGLLILPLALRRGCPVP